MEKEVLGNGDAENQFGNTENLFRALCLHIGIPPVKDGRSAIMTAWAALEYACVIAKISKLEKDVFLETVEASWKSVHGEQASVATMAARMPDD